VSEHLETCSECKKMLEDIHEGPSPEVASTVEADAQQPLANSLMTVKKKLQRKKLVTIIVSIACAIVVVSALTYGVFYHESPVPLTTVERSMTKPVNSAVDFIVNTSGHNSVHLILKDDALYVSYFDTVWSRFFAKPDNPQSFTIFDVNAPVVLAPAEPASPAAAAIPSLGISSPGSISAESFVPPEPPSPPSPTDPFALISSARKVYYVEADLRYISLNDLAFNRAAENAELIWEK